MTSTDYNDIPDHNLMDYVGNMYWDAQIQFIFQHDNPCNTQYTNTRYVHTWLDEHVIQVIHRVTRVPCSTKLELILITWLPYNLSSVITASDVLLLFQAVLFNFK